MARSRTIHTARFVPVSRPSKFSLAPNQVQQEFEERAARYQMIVARRAKAYPDSFAAIGADLGMTRQAAHKTWKKLVTNGAQLTGRPRLPVG